MPTEGARGAWVAEAGLTSALSVLFFLVRGVALRPTMMPLSAPPPVVAPPPLLAPPLTFAPPTFAPIMAGEIMPTLIVPSSGPPPWDAAFMPEGGRGG